MRELCQKAIEDAKTSTRDNLADKETFITIVADYCQNMEMPFFGKDQPGKTYYCTPKTIKLLGIIDCNQEKRYCTLTPIAKRKVERVATMLRCF
jgi:hypothetical protein